MIKKLLKLLKGDPITGREELVTVMNGIAVAQIKRDALTLQMDTEMQIVKDKYSGAIEQQTAQIETETRRVKIWAVTHRDVEFGAKKTIVIAGHELHFQQSPGAVECDGKEADVVDALVNAEGPTAEVLQEKLLRQKLALNKDAVLAEWRINGRTVPDDIAAFGIGVAQDESFTFTPARMELEQSAQKSAVESEAA